MVLPLVVIVAVLALLVLGLLWRRRRAAAKARAQRDDEIRASLADPGPNRSPDASPPAAVSDDAAADGDPWSEVVDLSDDETATTSNGNGAGEVDGRSAGPEPANDTDADPAGPPAAIRMVVSGTHPWAPARVFLTDLAVEGFEATVELPDLVVVRNADRLPITVREPAGPPGQLMVTAPPELLADTLEILVRSLLASGFSLDATDGRDVGLTDDDGAEVTLTVIELSRV